MEIFLTFMPTIMAGMEVVKRFVPVKYRQWAIPSISIVAGLLGGLIAGGSEVFMGQLADVLAGGAAGLSASATYSVAKAGGRFIGTEPSK